MAFNKLDLILAFAVPSMGSAAQLLRMKDTNSTGADDLTADAIDFASACIVAIRTGAPLPDLPKSLRPKAEAGEGE